MWKGTRLSPSLLLSSKPHLYMPYTGLSSQSQLLLVWRPCDARTVYIQEHLYLHLEPKLFWDSNQSLTSFIAHHCTYLEHTKKVFPPYTGRPWTICGTCTSCRRSSVASERSPRGTEEERSSHPSPLNTAQQYTSRTGRIAADNQHTHSPSFLNGRHVTQEEVPYTSYLIIRNLESRPQL